MSEEGTERKLTTILAADVVGFSRLMGEDEAGTLARLKSLRKDLVQPKITGGRGRTVKLMGDGLLAEFAPETKREARRLNGPLDEDEGPIKDLRRMAWSSIDNDDTRDIDQLTAVKPVSKDVTRILVAVADVDAVVKKGTAVDKHARNNTTTRIGVRIIGNGRASV